jgi:hypothetical protein
MRYANNETVRQQWLDVLQQRRRGTQRPTSWHLDIHQKTLMVALPMDRDLVFRVLLSCIWCWLVYMGVVQYKGKKSKWTFLASDLLFCPRHIFQVDPEISY